MVRWAFVGRKGHNGNDSGGNEAFMVMSNTSKRKVLLDSVWSFEKQRMETKNASKLFVPKQMF